MALARAVHDSLRVFVPDHAAALDSAVAETLARLGDSHETRAAVRTGQDTAHADLALFQDHTGAAPDRRDQEHRTGGDASAAQRLAVHGRAGQRPWTWSARSTTALGRIRSTYLAHVDANFAAHFPLARSADLAG